MANTPEARLKIVAENLARAALAELKRDVQGTGTAASGASVGFGKMVFAHGNLIASTANARRAANVFTGALQTLSFQAAGIPGPVGKAVGSIGAMGLGGGPVLLATAAVGALALGYRILTKDAREAGEAADKLTDSLKRQTLGGQFRTIGTGLRQAQLGLDEGGDIRPGEIGDPIGHIIQMLKRSALESAGEKGVDAVLAVRDARLQAGRDTIRSIEREADLIGLTTAEAARLKAGWLGLTEAETANYVTAATRLERRKEETRELTFQVDLLQQLTAITQDVETFLADPDVRG